LLNYFTQAKACSARLCPAHAKPACAGDPL